MDRRSFRSVRARRTPRPCSARCSPPARSVDLVVSRAARLTILDETGAPFRDAHWREDLAAWLGSDVTGADVGLLAGRRPGGRTEQRVRTRRAAWSWCRPARPPAPASRSACRKDLLQRAAEVNLKERRPVVVVPRETPVSRSHLAAPDRAASTPVRWCCRPVPASTPPARPRPRQQLVDFVAGKVLDAVGVAAYPVHPLDRRRSEPGSAEIGHDASVSAGAPIRLDVTADRHVVVESRPGLRPRAVRGPRTRGSGGGRRACGCCRSGRRPPIASPSSGRRGTARPPRPASADDLQCPRPLLASSRPNDQ